MASATLLDMTAVSRLVILGMAAAVFSGVCGTSEVGGRGGIIDCGFLSSVVVTSVVLSELEAWLQVVVMVVEPQCYALVGFGLFSPYCLRQALVR